MELAFNEKHGKLYEKHEQAKVETFYFENQHGKMANVFLKREIPDCPCEDILYDIITPYGFGGPMVIESTAKTQLIQDYKEAFSLYCKKENIVSEFVRFHPIENNDFREHFDGKVEYVGPQIIRDLSHEMNENISKRILKQYRSNCRKGMQVEFDQTGERLDDFLDIYYSTMERNNAQDYYYFDQAFFHELHEKMKGNFVYTFILMDGIPISGGLILYEETYAYGFLGGTREGYYDLGPNVNMLIEEIKWLKDHGLSYYLLGGGYKGNKDGIYQFKRKFANNSEHDYYIGKKIHDSDRYEELVKTRFKKTSDQLDTSYFPAYRAKLPQLNQSSS